MGTRKRTKIKIKIKNTRRYKRRHSHKIKYLRLHPHRSLRGGTLVGQGNYGCVFRPDILTKNNSLVSKVVLRNNIFNEFRHEYKILKKMKTIDPDGKFHSLVSSAFELTKNNLPNDFEKCSLSKPEYNVDEFYVFNIKYCGDTNLESYLMGSLGSGVVSDDTKLAIIFTLIANIIVGIYKMMRSNIVHKTLNADSIYLSEPLSLSNPFSLKIIDFGEGELRKYKNHEDSNHDYIDFFKNMIDILTMIQGKSQNKTIDLLLHGFKTLLQDVTKMSASKSISSYRNIITQYSEMLGNIFG
jgi:hypothetical protein